MDELQFQPKEKEEEASSSLLSSVARADEEERQRLVELAAMEDEDIDEAFLSSSDDDEKGGDLIGRLGGTLVGGWSAMVSTIKRVAVSEETEGMLGDVLQIANTLLQSEYNSAQILGAVRIMAGFRSNRPILTNRVCDDIRQLRHSFYWWQFAEASFGWALVHGLKFEAGFSGFAKGAVTSNDAVLEKYCKLKKEDIVYTQWDASPGSPSNFVAIDRRTKSVVWAVRGTFGLSDILTDLVAHSVPFLTPYYVAHKGMVKAVDSLVEKVWPIVLRTLEENPGYFLVTTGHSMGAAVSSMLAMWVRHMAPDVNVACWAFACPPCVSHNLAESTRGYIFGLSFGDDVITRLSLESLTMLKRRLRFVLDEGPGLWASITQGVAASAQVEERLMQMGIIVGDRWSFELELEKDIEKSALRLWAPSRQLYMYEIGSTIVAEESDSKHFGSIVLSSKLFNHHLPTSYDNAIIKLIRQLKLEQTDLAELATRVPSADGLPPTPEKVKMKE